MKGIKTVVDGQLIVFAIECELTLADSIAVTADKCRKEWSGELMTSLMLS